jgi:hypothetical protein
VLHETKRATYMLGTLEFCIHIDQNLVHRPHETLWKSLAPFRMVSGVGPVQPLINRWYRAKNQLNQRKYQTIQKNPKLGVSLIRGTCEPEKKFKTNMAMECIWTTETLRVQVFIHCNIRWLVYLCEACIIRLCRIGLKCLWQACTPKLWPHTRS